MNPVDLLGDKISIRVCIGMTHPYIEECGPLSLPETPTVDVKACIRCLVSPSGKLFASNGLYIMPAQLAGRSKPCQVARPVDPVFHCGAE